MHFETGETTQISPSIAFDGSMYYMVFRSNTTNEILCATSTDGSAWQGSKGTGETTNNPPAIAFSHGAPVIVFISYTSPEIRYIVYEQLTGTWTHSKVVEGETARAVSAVGRPDGKVLIIFQAETHNGILGAIIP
jgi:hypothetical protein